MNTEVANAAKSYITDVFRKSTGSLGDYNRARILRRLFVIHSIHHLPRQKSQKSIVYRALVPNNPPSAPTFAIKFSLCTAGDEEHLADENMEEIECSSRIDAEMSNFVTVLWNEKHLPHVCPVVHDSIHFVHRTDADRLSCELMRLHPSHQQKRIVVKAIWYLHIETVLGSNNVHACFYDACKPGNFCETTEDIYAVSVQLLVVLQVLREYRITHHDIHGRNVHVVKRPSASHVTYRLTSSRVLHVKSSMHVVLLDWDMSCKHGAAADTLLPFQTRPIVLQNAHMCTESTLVKTYGIQHVAFVPEVDVFATMGMLHSVNPEATRPVVDACIPPRAGMNPWHPRHICSSDYGTNAPLVPTAVSLCDNKFFMRHWTCIQPFMRFPFFLDEHKLCAQAVVPTDNQITLPVRPNIGDMMSPYECIDALHTSGVQKDVSWICETDGCVDNTADSVLPSAAVSAQEDASRMRLDTNMLECTKNTVQQTIDLLSPQQVEYVRKLNRFRKNVMLNAVCVECKQRMNDDGVA